MEIVMQPIGNTARLFFFGTRFRPTLSSVARSLAPTQTCHATSNYGSGTTMLLQRVFCSGI
jgi:hypothetical protein